MTQVVALKNVPKDVSDRTSKAVYNPLKQDFTHKFDGEDQTIPAGDYLIVPENIAVHLALHLARAIVRTVAKADREKLLKTLSDEKRVTADMKPYPLYNYRSGDVALLLVSDPKNPKAPKKEEILKAADEAEARAKDRGEIKPKEEVKPIDADLADDEEEEMKLEDMTLKQLREFADQTGIDLGKLTKKDDIIAKIEEDAMESSEEIEE